MGKNVKIVIFEDSSSLELEHLLNSEILPFVPELIDIKYSVSELSTSVTGKWYSAMVIYRG